MNLTDFENHIDNTILKRGKAYYEQGHIDTLEQVENGVWISTVNGSDEYYVEIELSKQGKLKIYECDCPYDGQMCKHVVAVLYAVLDKETISIDKQSKTTEKKKTKMTFQELLNKVSYDELKAFILLYSKKKNNLRSDFEFFFAEKNENFDIETQIRDLIGKTIKKYSKSYFIDYGSSKKLVQELLQILTLGQNYLSKNNLLDACTLSMVYIQEATPVITFADDSNGNLGDAIESGVSLLREIAEQSPNSLKERITDYLKSELQKEIYFDYGDFGYDMTYLYAELCVDVGKINDFLLFADLIIENEKQDGSNYRTTFFIKLKISMLEKANKSNEALELLEQEIHLPDVRKIIVETEIEKGRLEQAKKILEEGIKIAKREKHYGTITRWEKCLLRIAELQKDTKKIRFFCEKFAFESYFDSEFFHIWKLTFALEEWPQILEKKIDEIQKKIIDDKSNFYFREKEYVLLQKLGPIFIEENMYERLWDLVSKQKDLHTILSYHPYLYVLYPAGLMDLYQPLLDQHAELANDRSSYRRFLEIVLSIYKDIPTSRDTLKTNILRWKVVYKNRPAMVDELNKTLENIEVYIRKLNKTE